MAIKVVPYTPEWTAAVARCNGRLRAGQAPTAFYIPEQVTAVAEGPVTARYFLAVEEDEVRGSIIILEHPAWLAGERQTVVNLQSPLSEGIVDPRYTMVPVQLVRFALKRCPRAYVVGMGNEENPLPRLLKASGWKVRGVPFFFRVLRARRALVELRPLRRKPWLAAAAQVGAYTGLGAVALAVAQRPRGVSTAGYRTEVVKEAGAGDDTVWNEVERRLSFGVVRNAATLGRYLATGVERHAVYRGGEYLGWFSLLVAQLKDHAYFGNLKIATVVDLLPAADQHLAAFAALAAETAQRLSCDLVLSNQLRLASQTALRQCGFQTYGTNFLMASSPALSESMVEETSLVSRQDGDGLVNLVAL